MDVLIVEDEPLASERLTELISQCDASIRVRDTLDTVEDCVEFFAKENPVDLVFLDIQLSDGISFEIFSRIEVDTPVVFTTAYDQYALQAFKVNSIDYLLKPINPTELEAALQRFLRQQIRPAVDYRLLQQMHARLNSPYQSRFLVKSGNHYHSISQSDIAYFQADGKVVYLVTKEARRYVIDYTMERLEHDLLPPESFFRVNRTFIISIDTIQGIQNYANGRLKLTLQPVAEQDVIVSREKVTFFKAWLNS
ncbi:LytR/AlgR family response regulator transcription factor [Tunicatimonas pelagia]|uniref:LytR/AlgR family response regulator transcription factor n=1 Tax=Tunicatimonas pelagia TaxID=931531 RepID=UPI002666E090|nr:LytTR family DNA-binding domain-containing protein [Tunicatimonas pelagia]WKN41641.1 LytTR family DNA-binding domain-containing protein [Tunicatimonas pelagia]